MRASLQVAAGLLLAATLLSGCAKPILLKSPPAEEVIIEPGKLTVNGKVENVPWDAFYTFSDGKLIPHYSGFKLEPLIGADLVGLVGSPWAGLRFVHVENIGADFGFDRLNFTLGIDWLWHDIVIGPNIAFPYDLGNSHFGGKAAFFF